MLRRIAVAAIWLLASCAAFAGFHGGGASNFSGGQIQLDTYWSDFSNSNTQVTLNAFLNGNDSWSCVSGNVQATPDQIQSNGMPSPSASCMATGGLYHAFGVPLDSEQGSACGGGRCNWAWIWTGNCSVAIAMTFGSATTVSGNPGTTSSFGTNLWIFQAPAGNAAMNGEIIKTDGTCGNPQIVMVGTCTAVGPGCGDYDAYSAGVIFRSAYYKPILDGKFANFRAIGWETNLSIVTMISSPTYNKPYNYPFWYGSELRANIWIPSSEMSYSNTGGHETYTGTCTGGCTIETGSNGPQDRDTIQVQWNQTASSESDIYFSLNTTTAIPVVSQSCNGNSFTLPTSGVMAILIYSKQLNVWCNLGGSSGLFNGVPVKAIVQFANLVKANPVIAVPYLTLDPDDGWITDMATTANAVINPGLKLIGETPDEIWNIPSYPEGNYAINMATYNWSSGSFAEEQCMWASTIAQDLQRVIGGAPGVRWALQSGAQTAPNPMSPLITDYTACPDWVAANSPTPAQPGVQILPTREFNPIITVTSYSEPGERGLAREIIDAYNFVNSNQSTGSTIANNYMATLVSDVSATPNGTTLTSLNTIWQEYQTAIAADNSSFGGSVTYNGVTWNSAVSMGQYEGGVSLTNDGGCPSGQTGGSCFTSMNNFGAPAISNITAAVSGVVTLASTDFEGYNYSAVNGMPVTIFGAETAGFNQSCNVTGVAGSIITTNCNTVGLTYSDFTITTTAQIGKGNKTVAVSSCSGVTAGLSVFDETQTYVNGVVSGCTGTTLTVDQGFQHKGSGTSDTLLIGGGLMQYGTDTSGDGFTSASVSGATAGNPCSVQLAVPLDVTPPYHISITGVTPSGFNVSNGTYTVDSTAKNLTLRVSCSGTYVSGGTMSVTLDQAVNALRYAARNTAQAQTVTTALINTFAADGGANMAQYHYTWGGWVEGQTYAQAPPNEWGAFWPSPGYTPSPLWQAYVAANGGTYPYLLKRDLDPASNDNSPAFLNKAA